MQLTPSCSNRSAVPGNRMRLARMPVSDLRLLADSEAMYAYLHAGVSRLGLQMELLAALSSVKSQ